MSGQYIKYNVNELLDIYIDHHGQSWTTENVLKGLDFVKLVLREDDLEVQNWIVNYCNMHPEHLQDNF